MGLAPMPAGVPGGGLPPPPQGGAPQGGLPPGMQAPPANLGPVTVPQSNPGNAMQAIEKVKLAGKMIQEALPMIPMGSDGHNKLMKISTDLTKLVSESQDKVMQVQTLLQQLAAARQQNAQSMGPMAPPPNAGPAMAPPGAA